jgi:hypothetical protein
MNILLIFLNRKFRKAVNENPKNKPARPPQSATTKKQKIIVFH